MGWDTLLVGALEFSFRAEVLEVGWLVTYCLYKVVVTREYKMTLKLTKCMFFGCSTSMKINYSQMSRNNPNNNNIK